MTGVSNCCRLGGAINQERVLLKTSNFFVIPSLGSIGIEGYLLIIPQQHFLGIGAVPSSMYSELTDLIIQVKKVLKSEYRKSSLVFEHGPRIGGIDSGVSIDHAHLHVVPGVDITRDWAIDLMGRLGDVGMFYRVERVEGFDRAKDLLGEDKSYLYVENLDSRQLLSEQNFVRPPQYFRKMVADNINSSGWNWRLDPDYETLEKTVLKLRDKF